MHICNYFITIIIYYRLLLCVHRRDTRHSALAVAGINLSKFDPWGVKNPFKKEAEGKKRRTQLELSAATYVSSKTLKNREKGGYGLRVYAGAPGDPRVGDGTGQMVRVANAADHNGSSGDMFDDAIGALRNMSMASLRYMIYISFYSNCSFD